MEPNEGNWKEVLKQQFVELKKQIEDIRLIKSKRDRKKDINEDINDCDMTEDDKSTVLEPSDSDDDSVSNKTYKSNKTKINIFISLRKKIQNLEEKFFDTEQNKMTNEKTFYLFGHLLIRTFDKMKIYLNNFDIYTKEYSENLENIRKVLIQKQNQFRRLFYTKMLTTYDNDMLEYETILQHRMDKLKLSHSREPTFVELKTNCLDIFKSYIVQCINLHWALKVNGICGNLDEFIEYLFEQKIHMNEQERKSIEQACAYFDIPLVNPQIICRKQIHIKAKQSENFIPSQHIDESIEQEEKIDINLIGLIRLIQNDRWTVLLGGAGTSKTTFARWLIFQFARALSVENKNILIDGVDMGPARLPILIRVGEFAQWLEDHPSSNLFNYIGYHTWYGQHYVIDECESLKDFVRYGHAFIILDGLDEVATIELHKRVVSLVRAFIQSYCMSHEFISPFDDALITKEELEYAFRCEGLFRGNIILITSRILNYSIHPLNGKLITHYTIQPMNTEYIRSFVENWCSYAQDEIIHLFNQHIPAFKQNNIKCQLKFKSKDLIKKIETNEKLRTLVSNSLVLSLVCTLFAQHGIDTFDKTRIQVYHKIVELMLQRWQYDRLNISKDALISIFSNIAFYIHSHSGSGLIDEFDLSHLCLLSLQQWYEKNSNGIKTYVRSKIQQQTKSFMQLLSEDAGIVAARALAVFSFLHLTFQEYFVCYALINDNNNSNDKQNIEVLVNKFLLLFPNPRLREPLNLVLGWISLHWSSENYDKFCIQLQSKTNLNNKRVPLGSLYFVSSLNDLVCLPSFRIVFDILNTLLDAFIYEDTSTGIFRCRLRLALYDLPVALVDNWFKDQFSKEDPMTTSKLIHIIYDEVSRDDILANWITPLVCQLLWKTIGLFNEETAVYIDRILLLIGAKDSDRLPVRSGSLREYLLSKSLPKRKIHSSILTAIVALYGGLERTYSQAKRQTLVTFTARCMHRDSSLSSLFIEYIKNTKEEPAIKLKHLTDQCEKILTTTNSTDIMLQKVHSLIVLFCVYSIDQSSIYEQYVGSEVWQQAVQHMKIVLLYLREFFPVSPISKFKRNLTDIFEYFMDDVQENILDFAQSVSHAYCRLLRTKTSCLYREFYMHHDHRSPFAIKMPKKTELPNVADWNDDLLIRLLPFICCVSPIRCPTSYIEEIEVEDFKLLKVERHSFQLLQNKPITLLLAYVPTSVQNLYVQMLAQNQISSENPFCLPLQHLLVEFLQIMSVMEIFSIRFWILFTVLLPIITQNRMENFILRFIDRTQLEDDRKQFVKVYKDNCFASYASKVRIGDYEEKHYILEPALIEEQQRLKHAQTDLELYAAACCSISLIDSLDESIEWKSWETELNQSWNAVQKIVQPLWRLDAMITIYRILFFARKDDETNDRIKHWYLSIITCFQELEREIPLSMVVALFIRCMTFMHKDCRVKKDLFNSILQRLETVTIDEQKAICQALLSFSSLRSDILQHVRQLQHLENMVKLNEIFEHTSITFLKYFSKSFFSTADITGVRAILLASMHLSELNLYVNFLNDSLMKDIHHLSTNKPSSALIDESCLKYLKEVPKELLNVKAASMISTLLCSNFAGIENAEFIQIRQFLAEKTSIDESASSFVSEWLKYRHDQRLCWFAYQGTLLLASINIWTPPIIEICYQLLSSDNDYFRDKAFELIKDKLNSGEQSNNIIISYIDQWNNKKESKWISEIDLLFETLAIQTIDEMNEILALERNRFEKTMRNTLEIRENIDDDYYVISLFRLVRNLSLEVQEYIITIFKSLSTSLSNSTDMLFLCWLFEHIPDELIRVNENFLNLSVEILSNSYPDKLKILTSKKLYYCENSQVQNMLWNIVMNDEQKYSDELVATCISLLFIKRRDKYFMEKQLDKLKLLREHTSSSLIRQAVTLVMYQEIIAEPEKYSVIDVYYVYMANSSFDKGYQRVSTWIIKHASILLPRFIDDVYNSMASASAICDLHYDKVARNICIEIPNEFRIAVRQSSIGEHNFQKRLYGISKRIIRSEQEDYLCIYECLEQATLDYVRMFLKSNFTNLSHPGYFQSLRIAFERESVELLAHTLQSSLSLKQRYAAASLLVHLTVIDQVSATEVKNLLIAAIDSIQSHEIIDSLDSLIRSDQMLKRLLIELLLQDSGNYGATIDITNETKHIPIPAAVFQTKN